jgi:dissimilatory sulfite reductase beta subunit
MSDNLPLGIMPNPRDQLPELLLLNDGKWVSHEGLGPGVYQHTAVSGARCVTVRALMPPNGILSATSCRRLAELVERYAEVGRRTSRNSFEFIGVDPSRLNELTEELTLLGYPVGGTGNSLHGIKSCGGYTNCQNAAIDSPSIAKAIGDRFFDEVVAQNYPAYLKISVGGCPNQCGGGVEADIGILGVFKGLPQVDDAALVDAKCDVPLLCFWCPTGAIKPKPVRGGMSVEVNSERCIRCTSCANVCPTGIEMGGPRGAAVAVGGTSANTGKGPRLARLVCSFMPLSEALEYEPLLDLVGRILDVWKGGARPGERIGAYVDRVGWPAFLRRTGIKFDPSLIDDFASVSVRRNLQMRW